MLIEKGGITTFIRSVSYNNNNSKNEQKFARNK